MKFKAILTIAALLASSTAFAQTASTPISPKVDAAMRTDHYTFKLSDKVTRTKVHFKNRFGITLTADLYLPKNPSAAKLSALVISGPFGAVKEQSSGLYANQMAERGFAALAFDPSYTGESGGEPHNSASPEMSTEDFSAAVDFIGLQKNIDRNKIGIIGICGWGGFALNAVTVDKRVKAVATTSLYDIPRVMSNGYNDSRTVEERSKMLEALSQQRWADAEAGKPSYGATPNPDKLMGDEPEFIKSYFDYYKTPRGFHPRSVNSNAGFTNVSFVSLVNMQILAHIKEISPRPMLLIAGEKAHSRYMSEDIYKAAAEPKELMIIPNAVHVDLYDKVDVIPFAKLDGFFKTHLK